MGITSKNTQKPTLPLHSNLISPKTLRNKAKKKPRTDRDLETKTSVVSHFERSHILFSSHLRLPGIVHVYIYVS